MTSDLSPFSDGFPRVRLLKVDKDPFTRAYKSETKVYRYAVHMTAWVTRPQKSKSGQIFMVT